MAEIHKLLESAANVAIIVVALLFGAALTTKYFATSPNQEVPNRNGVEKNAKFLLSDIDWSTHEKNLVLAFSTKCRFCIESVNLYQELAQKRTQSGNFRMIVVSPEPPNEIKSFFDKHNIQIDNFVQTQLSDLSISGTPTLVLVDKNGIVQNTWRGKLPPAGESELIGALF